MTKKYGLEFIPNPSPAKPAKASTTPMAILALIDASAGKRITDAGRACDEMAKDILANLPDEPRDRLSAIAEARKWVSQADRCEQAAERQKLASALEKNDEDLSRRSAMAGLQ